MLKLGWKVVRAHTDRKGNECYRSVYMVARKAVVQYSKYRWVYPRSGKGPLCVFRSKAAATCFCAEGGFYGVIVRCEYIEAVGCNQVWINQTSYQYILLRGTVLAAAVRLLE